MYAGLTVTIIMSPIICVIFSYK